MLGEEAYLMMLEEENILRQMVREEELEKQVTAALNGEHGEGTSVDRKPDKRQLVKVEQQGNYDSSNTNSLLPGGGDGSSGVMVSPAVPHHHLDDFAHHNHLTRSQVEGLFMVLGPHYSNPGRRAPLKDFVLTSLVVLSTINNYRELNESKLFKSRGWMHKTIHQFCRMMVDHLSCLIEWPSEAYARDTMRDFENIVGLPGVIGALDTCHMPITKAPVGRNSRTYSNAMLFHSIHLMAVADARSRFTYVNVGRPGSFHESKVLRRSSLYEAMSSSPCPLFPPNAHLVADAAFPPLDALVTPYPTGGGTTLLTPEQKLFNQKLYRTRAPIDVAFQTMRRRWQRLKCLEMDEVTSMTQLVKCCCILHNICINNPGYSSTISNPVYNSSSGSGDGISGYTSGSGTIYSGSNVTMMNGSRIVNNIPAGSTMLLASTTGTPVGGGGGGGLVSSGGGGSGGLIEVVVEQPEDKEDLEVEYVGTQSMTSLQKRDMLAMYMNGQTLTLNIQ